VCGAQIGLASPSSESQLSVLDQAKGTPTEQFCSSSEMGLGQRWAQSGTCRMGLQALV
jgi:hypothetical protein